MRGRSGGIASNPVLIGAATVLVIVVAVFLSYNANQGLPFVPTYKLELESPSAANLVRGNEVRIGGARVGSVDAISAARRGDGSTFALLTLKLERRVAPLPKDSTFLIRTRSVLGQKYVEVTRGASEDGWDDGARVPVAQNRPEPVEFDDVANMFDSRTRPAIQKNLLEGGNALAGRGASLNLAIGSFRPLLQDIQPVLRTLSDERTGLARLVGSLADAATEVAPVAEEQAELFANLDRTFTAINEVRDAYQQTIAGAPAALDAGIEGFPRQRPFLRNSAALFADLRPGVRALSGALPDLAATVDVGTPTLRRSVAFNRRLEPLLRSVQDFAEDPVTPRGIARLDEVVRALRPTLRTVAPAQLNCNYLALLLRNGASVLSKGDRNGTAQRFIIIATPQGPNNEGGPSSAPASGPTEENHFHVNPYPHVGAPGEPDECEAGNEQYLRGRTVLSNTQRREPDSTEGDPRPARGRAR
jgi:virulence factor Mce-like protein